MLTRRGFTLVELLVALVLLGIVTAGIYRVLVNNQRMYQAQTQRIDLQQNIRAGATLLPAELRELDAADGDIVAMAPTSLTVRASRQLAFICTVPAVGGLVGSVAPVTMTIRADPFYGLRDFNITTDSVFVYYEGGQGTRSDDGWIRGQLTSIGAQNCADGSPGRQIVGGFVFGVNQVAQTGRIQNGSPVRGYEIVTYSVYQAGDGHWYLGYASTSGGGTRQPLIGPLIDANGVTFQYFTAAGVVTTVPAQVAQIRITLRAQTAVPIRTGSGSQRYAKDSIVTTVSLRNNRRWTTTAPGS
ncbi:MAG: prepilin-type N-terminal cleavage/methylation domain-containing protein [Gemmatimonadales bacterium]